MQLESFEPNLEVSVASAGPHQYRRPPQDLYAAAVGIAQHGAQTLAGRNRSIVISMEFIRQDQPVAETIVVSLVMMMGNQLANTFAQRALTEEIMRSKQESLMLRINLSACAFTFRQGWVAVSPTSHQLPRACSETPL